MESQLSAGIQDAKRDPPNVVALVVDGQRGSPIRHMATEIMAEIFLYCLPEDYPRPSAREAPLVLGRVCSLWRAIALSTPRLWATISMALEKGPGIDARAMEEWITRSGSCPLSIELGYWHRLRWTSQACNMASKVIEKILPYASRWENIDIHVPVLCSAQIVAALYRGTPLLRSLRIYIEIGNSYGSASEVIDVSSAPQLSLLKTSSMVHVHLGHSVRDSMRFLQLAYCASIDSCLRCLEFCPMLEYLNVTFGEPEIYSSRNPSTILRFPHLLTLKIHADFVDPGPILDRIHAPALKSCKIFIGLEEVTPSWPHLYALFERSNAPLEKLIIDAPLSENGLIDCLKLVPSLESLVISIMEVTDVTMHALTRPSGSYLTGDKEQEYLCPHMKDIRFCVDAPHESLVAMICSRWNGRSPDDESGECKVAVLRRAMIPEDDHDILSMVPEMSRCVKEGFNLQNEMDWDTDDEQPEY